MKPVLRRRPLALALLAATAALPAAALAQSTPSQHAGDTRHEQTPAELDRVIVTASPLQLTAEDLTRPVAVLSGEALDAQRGATLGQTVERVPGVQSSSFGPGVGRPIVRGLDGPRVQVLTGGLSSMDASTVSVDHAVSIEPFLADQIEVLKGPATLLYGSGAIGGAVNVVDGRIPEALPERPVEGRAEFRTDSASSGRTGAARLDSALGRVAMHVDVFGRDMDDLRIPGYPESAALMAEEGEEPDPAEDGRLENSAVTASGGALGLSWIGERGFIGASVSGFDTRYGIPGHAHEHEEAGPLGLGRAADAGLFAEGDEEAVRIDLEQRRLDVKGGLRDPFASHENLTVRVGRADYTHTEFEGAEVGTVFENDQTEGRVELVHGAIAGWRGAYGLQYGRRDFVAIGDEAFVPGSLSRDTGLFLVETRSFGELDVELGLRGERVEIEAEGFDDFSTSAFSVAAGVNWHFSEDWHLQAGLDRAERAPSVEELFSDGPHIATQSYELGDAGLENEVANRAEVGLAWHPGAVRVKGSVYYARFQDFIYLADTGLVEDDLPLRQWTQGDADFLGAELEATVQLADNASGAWEIAGFADTVRAELRDGGGDLPRIPATRVGADLRWSQGPWRGELGAVRYARQDRVADGESETPGYTLVHAQLAYHWDVGQFGWELFVDGRNLTDEEVRPHTSFLKDLAPLAGRSIGVGARVFF
jgi:iron complex outermembrane receptor protein